MVRARLFPRLLNRRDQNDRRRLVEQSDLFRVSLLFRDDGRLGRGTPFYLNGRSQQVATQQTAGSGCKLACPQNARRGSGLTVLVLSYHLLKQQPDQHHTEQVIWLCSDGHFDPGRNNETNADTLSSHVSTGQMAELSFVMSLFVVDNSASCLSRAGIELVGVIRFVSRLGMATLMDVIPGRRQVRDRKFPARHSAATFFIRTVM